MDNYPKSKDFLTINAITSIVKLKSPSPECIFPARLQEKVFLTFAIINHIFISSFGLGCVAYSLRLLSVASIPKPRKYDYSLSNQPMLVHHSTLKVSS